MINLSLCGALKHEGKISKKSKGALENSFYYLYDLCTMVFFSQTVAKPCTSGEA